MNNNNELLSLICKNNHIRVIDKNFLKHCELLKGANIFLRLFNLDENSPFGKYDMHKDENCHFTILKDYNISTQEWDLLIHFLRYGFTLSYNEDSGYRKRDFLEKTCHVANILGGIPSFDKFYIQHNKNYIILYNPTTPEKDEKLLYNWTVSTPYSMKNKEDRNNWNVTKKTTNESNYFYYRKLKE